MQRTDKPNERGPGWEILVTGLNIPKLLYLNRQFTKEYQESQARTHTIKIKDTASIVPPPERGAWIDRVSKAEFRLLAICGDNLTCALQHCELQGNLPRQYGYVSTVCKLHNFQEVVLKFYPCRDSLQAGNPIVHQDPLDMQLHQFVDLPSVSRIEVYPLYELPYSGAHDSFADVLEVYSIGGAPEAVWTKADGWSRDKFDNE